MGSPDTGKNFVVQKLLSSISGYLSVVADAGELLTKHRVHMTEQPCP